MHEFNPGATLIFLNFNSETRKLCKNGECVLL
jgi:hypothetical protein